MLSRAVLPLTRPHVLASAARASRVPRVSALSVQQPRWYAKGKGTPYELPKSMQDESTKSKKSTSKKQPDSEKSESDKTKPETDAAESNTPEPEQIPNQPLPDLTQGIPSTLAAELEGRMKKGGPLNITEDHTQSDEYSEDGRGGDIPKSGYETSLDRRKARMANIMYAVMLAAGIAGLGYLGRNWETEEEQRAHVDQPSGWSPGLWWSRIKARTSDLTSYYKDPAFPQLLPDEDPNLRQPYTLVLSMEDLLVHSEWSREHGWRVAKRPGVDYFLRYLNQYYELVLFTTVPSMMADQVLRKLDPYRIIRWPLFREATRYKDGEYIKDLSYLNRDLSKVILIDTKEEHARLQPENAVILDKWTGDPKDKTLVALIPFLEYMAGMGVEDVRPVLKSFEGSQIPIEFAKREKAMRERFEKELTEEKKKKPAISMGSIASALGLKSTRTLDGEISPSEGLSQGKMLWDQIRERGQKNYELIDREIRENGEKWLAEMAAEEEKARQEQMQNMKGSFTGMFGVGGNKQ
ncbi:Mitochondrial import inner membrane translocase subunit tim50 [Penicillium sp. IBT 16267x]|nr:Mitochondrial import inner membrane translocase subunit tim50 [Penicillium sp. IBT 16267x]